MHGKDALAAGCKSAGVEGNSQLVLQVKSLPVGHSQSATAIKDNYVESRSANQTFIENPYRLSRLSPRKNSAANHRAPLAKSHVSHLNASICPSHAKSQLYS